MKDDVETIRPEEQVEKPKSRVNLVSWLEIGGGAAMVAAGVGFMVVTRERTLGQLLLTAGLALADKGRENLKKPDETA